MMLKGTKKAEARTVRLNRGHAIMLWRAEGATYDVCGKRIGKSRERARQLFFQHERALKCPLCLREGA